MGQSLSVERRDPRRLRSAKPCGARLLEQSRRTRLPVAPARFPALPRSPLPLRPLCKPRPHRHGLAATDPSGLGLCHDEYSRRAMPCTLHSALLALCFFFFVFFGPSTQYTFLSPPNSCLSAVCHCSTTGSIATRTQHPRLDCSLRASCLTSAAPAPTHPTAARLLLRYPHEAALVVVQRPGRFADAQRCSGLSAEIDDRPKQGLAPFGLPRCSCLHLPSLPSPSELRYPPTKEPA
jgi:hypothetical protein